MPGLVVCHNCEFLLSDWTVVGITCEDPPTSIALKLLGYLQTVVIKVKHFTFACLDKSVEQIEVLLPKCAYISRALIG